MCNSCTIPYKELFERQVIDPAFKKIAQSKSENMITHFVYAGELRGFIFTQNDLNSLIRQGMKKYKIKKVMATCIFMHRQVLIPKEEMDNYCKEKKSKNNRSMTTSNPLLKIFDLVKNMMIVLRHILFRS